MGWEASRAGCLRILGFGGFAPPCTADPTWSRVLRCERQTAVIWIDHFSATARLATPAAKRREPERGLRLSVCRLRGAPPLRQWYCSRGAELPARVHDDHVIVTSHRHDRSVQRGRGIGGRRRISHDCRRASGTRAGRARLTHEELVPRSGEMATIGERDRPVTLCDTAYAGADGWMILDVNRFNGDEYRNPLETGRKRSALMEMHPRTRHVEDRTRHRRAIPSYDALDCASETICACARRRRTWITWIHDSHHARYIGVCDDRRLLGGESPCQIQGLGCTTAARQRAAVPQQKIPGIDWPGEIARYTVRNSDVPEGARAKGARANHVRCARDNRRNRKRRPGYRRRKAGPRGHCRGKQRKTALPQRC